MSLIKDMIKEQQHLIDQGREEVTHLDAKAAKIKQEADVIEAKIQERESLICLLESQTI